MDADIEVTGLELGADGNWPITSIKTFSVVLNMFTMVFNLFCFLLINPFLTYRKLNRQQKMEPNAASMQGDTTVSGSSSALVAQTPMVTAATSNGTKYSRSLFIFFMIG